MVVGVQTYEKRTIYTLDDGTEVIDCVFRHPVPAKPDSTTAAESKKAPQRTSPKRQKLPASSIEPTEPPLPVAEVGYPVRVIGRVARHYQSRQIIAESIELCKSALDESTHWLRVVELHKSKYSIALPFVIPPPTSAGCEYATPLAENASVFTTTEAVYEDPVSYKLAPPAPPQQMQAYNSRAQVVQKVSSAGAARVPWSPTASSVVSSTPSSPVKESSAMEGLRSPSRPKLRHPSRLHSRDLVSNTFRLYLKHYMDNANTVLNPKNRCHESRSSLGSEDRTPTKRRVLDNHHNDNEQWTPRPFSLGSKKDFQSSHQPQPPPVLGFTLSHLRRVPELDLLAARIVRAEMRRRMKAEKAETGQRTQTQLGVSSRTAATPFMNTSNSIKPRTSKQHAHDPPRAKMKRLFQWALVRLYEEGSIVLWDGPSHPLPSTVPGLGTQIGATSLTSSTPGNDTVFFSESASLFSTSHSSTAAGLSLEGDESTGYVSDPPSNEDAYVPLTPELLSVHVKDAIIALKRKRQGRGTSNGRREDSSMSDDLKPEDITAYLRRTDGRWENIGVWAVEEALEVLHN
ncbi:hypothetical protein ID866_7082 [Astraeus odoratus]|nr:hypothetical protein ID866_7082 [Astraeus odoratus]